MYNLYLGPTNEENIPANEENIVQRSKQNLVILSKKFCKKIDVVVSVLSRCSCFENCQGKFGINAKV